MSAVIIIGLVVMWAVVLIPMWLRRHDEHEESRSVDRFTSAMHTLSRREAKQARESSPSIAAERYGLMPRQVRNVEVHVSGASAPQARRQPERVTRASSRVTAAQRRRRTLTGLLLVTVVFLVAAVLTGSLIVWALQVVADLAVAGFVVNLRRLAIAAAANRPARSAPRRVAEQPAQPVYESYEYEQYEEYQEQPPRVTVRRYASEASYDQPVYDDYADASDDTIDYSDDYEVAAAPAAAIFDQYEEPAPYQPVEDDEPIQPVATTVIFDQEIEPEPIAQPQPRPSFIEAGAQPGRRPAEPEPAPQVEPIPGRVETTWVQPPRSEPQASAASVGGSPWEPVPVPRPTYTMKPAAPPRRRRDPIDEPLLPPVETVAEMDPADELEEILDRRWAVND